MLRGDCSWARHEGLWSEGFVTDLLGASDRTDIANPVVQRSIWKPSVKLGISAKFEFPRIGLKSLNWYCALDTDSSDVTSLLGLEL